MKTSLIRILFGILLSSSITLASEYTDPRIESCLKAQTQREGFITEIEGKKGIRLKVCGEEDVEFSPSFTQRRISEFVILEIRTGARTRILDQGGALEDTMMTIKKGELALSPLWMINGQSTAVIERTVKCPWWRAACKVTQSHCLLKLPENPYPESLTLLKDRIASGQLEGEPFYYDLVRQVFEQALGNDEEAEAFLQTRPDILDGEYGETWTNAQEQLLQAKTAKCY